jgi:hypothetical protein
MNRSANMRAIRSKDTKPEMFVRRFVHSQGYRYRLHVPNLPGKPNLVFPRSRKVIFVHGCFWHLHKGCHDGRIPESRIGKGKCNRRSFDSVWRKSAPNSAQDDSFVGDASFAAMRLLKTGREVRSGLLALVATVDELR